VTLEPALEGLVVPSKFYGVLAAGRPVIFVGSPEGELARVIRDSGCGAVVTSGDAIGLARTVRELAADPERMAEMGRRALGLHRERYAREHAFAAWERVLLECVGSNTLRLGEVA
jgi:glycosyltransferase involved in cell wall biosynthesis